MFEIEKIIIIIIFNAKYLSNYEQWHACNKVEIKEKYFFKKVVYEFNINDDFWFLLINDKTCKFISYHIKLTNLYLKI